MANPRNLANIAPNIYGSNGNVGVGTSSPAVSFEVNKSSGEALRVAATGANQNIYSRYIGGSPNVANLYVGVDSAAGGITGNGASGFMWQVGNAGISFGTNNTERMRIDSSGRTTTLYQPSFRAGRGSTQTVTTGSTIIFDTASGGSKHNVGSSYSTSTGVFTAPVTGIYYFHAQVMIESATAGGDYSDLLGFTINGGTYAYSEKRCFYVANYTGTGGYFVDNISAIFSVTAGDSVICKNGSSSTVNIHGNANYSIFEGYLLG